MRPLLVILHERSLQSLTAAARFWDLSVTSDASDLVGSLYPLLTDAWQLALGLERIGPLAWKTVALLGHHRTLLRPSEFAAELGSDEASVLAVLRRLYSAAVVATLATDEGPALYLPTELARLASRLQHERDQPLSTDAEMTELLDRLTDHEVLELAERYGMRVLPTVTTREEAVTYLAERFSDPVLHRNIRTSLSPRAQQLLEQLSEHQQPLRVSALLADPHWPFGDLRRAVAELSRWGLVWRTETNGRLALLLPSLLANVRIDAASPQPITHVESTTHRLPLASLLDLLSLLVLVQRRNSHRARATSAGTMHPNARAIRRRWFHDDPHDQAAYLEFLQRIARTLGLLGHEQTLDSMRLASWLRLSFPEQGRRLLRAWRFTLDPTQRSEAERLLKILRSLNIDTWYEWPGIVRQRLLSDMPEHRHERFARELDWLGVVTRGQSANGTLAVRLTQWGAWLLGLRADPPVQSLFATITAPGCPPIELQTLTPEGTWLLYQIGDLLQTERKPVWHLTPQSVARYVAAAVWSTSSAPRPPEELGQVLLRTLEAAHGRPLPPVWRETLLGWFAQSRPAMARPALYLRFSSSADREHARAALETAQWRVTPFGEHDLLIVDFETRHRARLVSLLRRAGFILEWWSGPDDHGTPRLPPRGQP